MPVITSMVENKVHRVLGYYISWIPIKGLAEDASDISYALHSK